VPQTLCCRIIIRQHYQPRSLQLAVQVMENRFVATFPFFVAARTKTAIVTLTFDLVLHNVYFLYSSILIPRLKFILKFFHPAFN